MSMTETKQKVYKKPKLNRLLILVFTVFFLEVIYMQYLKEKSVKEYELLAHLNSLSKSYKDIDAVFRTRNNYQNFDDIVLSTQKFLTTLNHIETHINEDLQTGKGFNTLYSKLTKDYQTSIEYVEHYKSNKGVVINSTRHLYDSHNSIEKKIIQSMYLKDTKSAVDLFNEIMTIVSLLEYDGLRQDQDIKTNIEKLKSETSWDIQLSKTLSLQYRHINVLLEGHNNMLKLKKANKGLAVENTIHSLYLLLLDNLKKHDKKDTTNIYALNIFIFFLLLFLFYNYKKEAELHAELLVLNHELEHNMHTLMSVNTEMTDLIDKFDDNVIASKTDPHGIITYATKAFSDISGYSKEELLGHPHNIVRHPDMPSALFKDMWNTLAVGNNWTGEIKNLTKDKKVYWVQTFISPEFNKEGKCIGYSAIRHDITAKKAFEELSASLEDQVRLRTIELEEMVKKVEKLSITDELTGLYNRRYYAQVFDHSLKQSQRNKKCFNYLLLDIDNFKLYNDCYGHQLGDTALQKVSQAFKETLHRPDDLIFRMGGEEFVIIFESDNKEKGLNFAQKIINIIASLQIEHLKSLPLKVLTISAGLVSLEAADSASKHEEELYQHADKLLYQAKDTGRNRVSHN